MGRSAVVAVLGAAAVFLAGCGGAGDDVDASGAVSGSPIAEYLGVDAGFSADPEAAEAELIAEERARQEAVAACMREAGFEYIPQDPSQYIDFSVAEEEFDRETFVNTYGFGVTTQWFSQAEVGPGLVGYDDEMIVDDDMPDDPNAAIVEAMSDAEREAYYQALYGVTPEFEVDESMTEEEANAAFESESFELSGCQGAAFEGEQNELVEQFYEEFGSELEQIYERVLSDPRIVEAEREVKECATEKGFPNYPGANQVFELWEAELQEISGQITYPDENLTEADYEAMSETQLEELFNQPAVFAPEALATLGEIQAEELAMAKAVFECGGLDDGGDDLFGQVYAEYEQQFLDDNRARLDQLKSEGG